MIMQILEERGLKMNTQMAEKTSHAGDTPIYTSTGTDTLLLYDTSTPLDLRKLGEDTNRRKRDQNRSGSSVTNGRE